MTKQKQITFDDLLDKLKNNTDEEISLLKKSYEYASKIYFGKTRLMGDEYINHPLNVAFLLTNINADIQTICAGLLHAVYNFEEDINIEADFGSEIRFLVEGVNKIRKLNFDLSTESSITMQKKILVGLTDDVRIIFIRLADRVDVMRNLWVYPEEKKKKIANETLEVLIPIAHRLGINQYKSELEDLSLRYLKPDIYFDIVDKLNQTKKQRDEFVYKMIQDVSKILNDNGIKHQIKGRSKSIYSIYKKLDKGKKFSEIYDLLALRIFVDTESECYQALGLIHSKFKPKPKRFKDYIANPKTNMYQSLHTTVFGYDGYLYEIQIRTYKMDEVAERGIASHWSYKENGSNKIATKNMMEDKLQFFRTLMDMNNDEITDREFVNSVKKEFSNTIYVFTPNGDVIELPNGATPIDFAYRVHSGVGNKMVGAIVNGNLVPLDYVLKNEDVVKINTNKNSIGPSREWINMATTAQAKNKIKSFFKKIDREEYLKKGEELLKNELRKKKIPTNEFFTIENIDKLLKELKVSDLNELYILLGDNKISTISVINTIYEEEESKEKKLLKKVSVQQNNQVIKNDIIIEGIDEIKIKLSSCCKPIPGDKIIGFITKGYGISIHRMNCPNVENLNERFINASWNDVSGKKYKTDLLIKVKKSENALLDIISKASNCNINIDSIQTYNNLDDIIFEMTILVEDGEHLSQFINNIKSLQNCIMVERSIK